MLRRRENTAQAAKMRRASGRMTLGCATTLAAVVLASLGMLAERNVAAQTPSYASGTEYKSLLQQLHDDPVRPSRMGTGSLLAQQAAPPRLDVREDRNTLRIACAQWKLEIAKQHGQMAVTNQRTGLVWRLGATPEEGGVAWTRSPKEKTTAVSLAGLRSIERTGNRWRMQVALAGSAATATIELDVLSAAIFRLSIRMPNSESNAQSLQLHLDAPGPFFGLGERFDRVKLDGLQTTLRPEDLLGKPGHNWTYIPVPFLFTPRGLGLYLDTAKVSRFDLSGASRGDISVQLDDPSVDVYFFAGTPKEILEAYTSLTGRTPAPPAWAYGVWICSYRGLDAVLRDARKLREDKIPSSAIWTFDVMDKGDLMGWPLWWTGYYPDPRKFTDQLHAMGFKSLTYIHPYLRSVLDPYNLASPAFTAGAQNGLFVLDAQGQPTGPTFERYRDDNIDFTRPSSVDWWAQKIQEIVEKDNFDGWMEDFGEWINETDRFAAGVSGRTMANLNPLFYHRITYEVAHALKPDFVAFDRSGYAGSQGYTRVVWGGDQFPNWSQDYGLPSALRAGITAGLSGFSVWGPDIAENGFSRELWTRWVEFGALTPIMRDHPWDKPEGAINLWTDAATEDSFRRYARLHVSLFPIFEAYAQQAAATGVPVMRHLLLEFPDDPKTYDCNDEYMIGDKILVAPVIEQGATTRTLYLPQGSWTDYWTGKIIEGGREVTVDAPLQQIPLFVRSGSILPSVSPDTETLASDLAGGHYRTLSSDITWRIFGASTPTQSSFTLADGTVAGLTQNPSQLEIKVDHAQTTRRNEIVLSPSRPPQQVLLAGRPLPETQAATSSSGWQWDTTTRTVHVVFQGSDYNLRIRF